MQKAADRSTTKNDHAVRGIKMIMRAWPRLTALYAIQKDTTAHGVRLRGIGMSAEQLKGIDDQRTRIQKTRIVCVAS